MSKTTDDVSTNNLLESTGVEASNTNPENKAKIPGVEPINEVMEEKSVSSEDMEGEQYDTGSTCGSSLSEDSGLVMEKTYNGQYNLWSN